MIVFARRMIALFALLLVMHSATAVAHRGIEVEGDLRFRSTDSTVIFGTPGGNVTCAATLEGTLVALFTKQVGGVIGSHTSGRINSAGCGDGIAGAAAQAAFDASQFPWRMTYQGINGTLPNFTGIRTGARWRSQINLFVLGFLIANCQYDGELLFAWEAPRARFMRPDGLTLIPLVEGEPEVCEEYMTVSADFALSRTLTRRLQT